MLLLLSVKAGVHQHNLLGHLKDPMGYFWSGGEGVFTEGIIFLVVTFTKGVKTSID